MQLKSLDAQTVTSLVRAATAAPSLHNAQPWRFRFLSDSATFQVRAALDRALPRADPHGRALHMGCAAALFNLRVAAAHAGWLPVTTLLPDPYEPRLLATVRMQRPVIDHTAFHPAMENNAAELTERTDLAALYPAIRQRHTCRRPFREEPVPGPARAALVEAARREGAHLHWPAPGEAWAVLEVSRDAEGRDLAAFTTSGTGQPSPQLALLGTAEDRPLDWLRAGQALERVLLVATSHGLSAALSSHTPEWSEPHAPERPQLVLRIGYADAPSPATQRRAVSLVLDIV
ncbi:Acg family FMN-binding oxidoreductase [Streptomyces sp. 6N223]|uniref:Acg family FMN-binding oxidoreductase n=1 Tax=Streptomyces sp. 6N223 TaxID=3457412 RepID=UPI003FD48AC8